MPEGREKSINLFSGVFYWKYQTRGYVGVFEIEEKMRTTISPPIIFLKHHFSINFRDFVTTSNKRKQQKIQHYIGFQEGKRAYTHHKLEVNGSKIMELTKADLSLDKRKLVGRARFELATFRLSELEEWLNKKQYVKAYVKRTVSYAKQYGHCLFSGNYQALIEAKNQHDKLSAIANLAKFTGRYDVFRADIKKWGIKWSGYDAGFKGFLNIISNRHEGLRDYVTSAYAVALPNERLFIEFLASTGLRVGEACIAFNLIIKLQAEGRLGEYYNEGLQCLEHYKFPELFLRRTKKAYVSFVDMVTVGLIGDSKPVNYNRLVCELKRQGCKLRLKQLRSYHNSRLYKAGIQSELIDIVAGRVPKSVFQRHYLTINLKDHVFTFLSAQEACFNSLMKRPPY
ncbi:MAG: hypothetical protein LBC03_07415 [Nitrososphaerota archaeon]|jgi:hypothetical protein|nr:hypothetical protein [Nitrososphaerota archaeon]